MAKPRITLLALVLTLPLPAHAEDHLVSLADVQARMKTQAGERVTALTELEGTLAAAAGLKPTEVRAALAMLGDDELQELQERAAVLRTDPAATGGRNYAAGFVLGAVAAILFWLWVASQLAGT
jgi:hypothetical protein